MYETIKNIAPRNFLKNNEPIIRKIIYAFYKGNKKQCPLCKKKLRKFISLKNGETLCPFCGSLPRHRRLWTLIEPLLVSGSRVLDFSPPLYFYKKLRSFGGIHYIATDFEGEFIADQHLDITNINLSANSIDLILCVSIQSPLFFRCYNAFTIACFYNKRFLLIHFSGIVRQPFYSFNDRRDVFIVNGKSSL